MVQLLNYRLGFLGSLFPMRGHHVATPCGIHDHFFRSLKFITELCDLGL